MILIEEKVTKKLPGETSLFISFQYNAQIIDILKQQGTYNYNKNDHTWELPICSLSQILDRCCYYDDIKFVPRKSVEQNINQNDIVLSKTKTKLYDYQEDAVKFGLTHNKWLLLDPPGLGKSIEIIYTAQELKNRENIQHCLIVCGVNTLKSNWKAEIKKHSDLSCRILGERTTKRGRTVFGTVSERLQELKKPIKEFFVITNIETLRNDNIIKELNSDKNNRFDMIVVDECHVAKSVSSQQGKNLLKLKNAKYKIAATGTPITNNPIDVYSALKWIDAERANNSTFKYFYCEYGGQFNHELLGYKNLNYLKEQLSKVSLRRSKDILNLPPKTVINEVVDMDEKQQTFYDNIKDGVVDQVDKVGLDTQSVIGMLVRLRQATASPSILTSEDIPSAKIDRAVNLAKDIISNGDKVVIFSTFKESANKIYELLKDCGATLNTGDVSDGQIEKNVNDFQTDDKTKCFIATWQKCGTGITLTKASYMIFIDTPWTPAQYLQAQDRIYRVGTTKNVIIYNLICNDTVDERVNQIVNDKELIGDFVIDDKSPKIMDRLKQIILDL